MEASKSLNDSGKTFPQENNKGRQEILYNGNFYDITDFISKHPGGNVIKFYTEYGEDASHAIQQFHYRSMGKVDAIMKSFRKRVAEQQESGSERKDILRNTLLSDDFNQLFEQLTSEGYFEPSFTHVIIRLVEVVALFIFTLSCFLDSQSFLTKFLSTIPCGFALSRFGWLQHEGGHNSLTGNPKIDKMIQDFATCFTLGGSSIWWNSQHNRHHAMPQRLEHDVDLATLPFVAFHKRAVKDSNQINAFFIRYQAFFYFTIDSLIAAISWRYILHPRYQLRKKAYHELALGLPSLFLSVYVVGTFWYFAIVYWFSFFMGINFALSHSHLDVAENPTHWVEYSLTHTVNIKPSLFVDYFMGYLNYQIEHHLFPTMPQFRQKEISHRVKMLAEKHGLPYRVLGYTEACGMALKNLNDVGTQLTKNKI